MNDLYVLIAIGSAVALGAIPLIKQIIKLDSDFLIGHSLNKSLMSQAEKDECKKLGYTAFMRKVEEDSQWRKKHNIPYEQKQKGGNKMTIMEYPENDEAKILRDHRKKAEEELRKNSPIKNKE